MIRAARYLLAMLLLGPPSLNAQITPQQQPTDPRLQTLQYDPGQIVQLHCSPGFQLTIQLSPDEQVQNVSIGDSAAWQVSINKAGDHLFIKPAQAGPPTNMTVITSVRVYNFELVALMLPSSDVAYTVQFTYPASPSASSRAGGPKDPVRTRLASRYRIGGDRTLRPGFVSDDGEHTFVSWPPDQAIPATFQIGDDGEDRVVNGVMRGDEFVIDGVARKLVFRIDRRTAYAEKLSPRHRP